MIPVLLTQILGLCIVCDMASMALGGRANFTMGLINVATNLGMNILGGIVNTGFNITSNIGVNILNQVPNKLKFAAVAAVAAYCFMPQIAPLLTLAAVAVSATYGASHIINKTWNYIFGDRNNNTHNAPARNQNQQQQHAPANQRYNPVGNQAAQFSDLQDIDVNIAILNSIQDANHTSWLARVTAQDRDLNAAILNSLQP